MTSVVQHCQRLFVGISVVVDLTLELVEDLFDGGQAEVRLLNDVHVYVEVVLLDVLAEDFHVLLDFGEVCEAFLNWISVFAHSHIADGSVVYVAKDETLAFIWGEVRQTWFAKHCKCLVL